MRSHLSQTEISAVIFSLYVEAIKKNQEDNSIIIIIIYNLLILSNPLKLFNFSVCVQIIVNHNIFGTFSVQWCSKWMYTQNSANVEQTRLITSVIAERDWIIQSSIFAFKTQALLYSVSLDISLFLKYRLKGTSKHPTAV